MDDFVIRNGFEETHRVRAAELYMQAFDAKIGFILGGKERSVEFLASVLKPDYSISAVSRDGTLLGVAGFKTKAGSFVGGELSDLTASYGQFGGLWRGLLLSFLERETEPENLLMDGICVAEHARGQGVGSALLDAVSKEAEQRGVKNVRLDVIDSNPRAKALYLRKGFVEGETSHLGPLKYLFGFSSATTMRLAV